METRIVVGAAALMLAIPVVFKIASFARSTRVPPVPPSPWFVEVATFPWWPGQHRLDAERLRFTEEGLRRDRRNAPGSPYVPNYANRKPTTRLRTNQRTT